jgi:hypothetical protein
MKESDLSRQSHHATAYGAAQALHLGDEQTRKLRRCPGLSRAVPIQATVAPCHLEQKGLDASGQTDIGVYCGRKVTRQGHFQQR